MRTGDTIREARLDAGPYCGPPVAVALRAKKAYNTSGDDNFSPLQGSGGMIPPVG